MEKDDNLSIARFLLSVMTLWRREIIRFRRQRSRLVSAFAQPFVFWLLLGGGLSQSFRPPGVPEETGYFEYLYTGIIVLILLFTAIFATISIVQDRREGFLQGVLVAPVPRWRIVLGQSLGGTTLALLEGVLFLFLAPVVGVPLSVPSVFTSGGYHVFTVLWVDKPGIDDCVAYGFDPGISCDYEFNSFSDLGSLRRLFPYIRCANVA